MSDSKELKTLMKCTPQLETALLGLDSNLVHFLYEEGFITDGVRNKILNPATLLSEADKAIELVKWIRNRVKQDKKSYHVLVRWFKQVGKLYQPIVDTLEAEYYPSASVHDQETRRTEESSRVVEKKLPDLQGASESHSKPSKPCSQSLPAQSNKAADFSAYVSSLPACARPHLKLLLDCGHEGVDKDLNEIADQMLEWEVALSSHLGLTDVDIHDIIKIYGNPVLQRREALRRWKNNKGLDATYGNLLELSVIAGHSKCANAICEVLKKKSR